MGSSNNPPRDSSRNARSNSLTNEADENSASQTDGNTASADCPVDPAACNESADIPDDVRPTDDINAASGEVSSNVKKPAFDPETDLPPVPTESVQRKDEKRIAFPIRSTKRWGKPGGQSRSWFRIPQAIPRSFAIKLSKRLIPPIKVISISISR